MSPGEVKANFESMRRENEQLASRLSYLETEVNPDMHNKIATLRSHIDRMSFACAVCAVIGGIIIYKLFELTASVARLSSLVK